MKRKAVTAFEALSVGVDAYTLAEIFCSDVSFSVARKNRKKGRWGWVACYKYGTSHWIGPTFTSRKAAELWMVWVKLQ